MANKKKRKKTAAAKRPPTAVPDEPVDSRLTPRELDTLAAIKAFIEDKGVAPTTKALSTEMGGSSKKAQEHIKGLFRKRCIEATEKVRLHIRRLTTLGEKTLRAERALEQERLKTK